MRLENCVQAPPPVNSEPAGWGAHRVGLWVAAGIVASLLVSVLAVHGDLDFILYASHFAADGKWNVYQTVYETTPARIESLTYPPLAYLLFGGLIKVGRLVGLFNYDSWRDPMALGVAEYLSVRLVYAAFVLLTAWTVRRYARLLFAGEPAQVSAFATEEWRTEEWRRSAALSPLLVVTSPIIVFVCFIFGQFDIIPASLLFLSAYLLSARRPFWAVQVAFLGVWLKNFPILFIALALPLLWSEFGARRTVIALATGLLGTAMWLIAFRSPGFRAGFLAFRHTDYDVIALVGAMGVRVTLSNLMFVGVFVTSVLLASFRTSISFPKKVFAIYAGTLLALLAPRFWMPQYMAWLAPVLIVYAVIAAQTRSCWAAVSYLAINGIYLLLPCVLFPGNVDTVMFRWVMRGHVPGLARRLGIGALGPQLWTALFALLMIVGAVLSVWTVAPGALRRVVSIRPVSSPKMTWAMALASTVMIAGFVALHLGNAFLARLHFRS